VVGLAVHPKFRQTQRALIALQYQSNSDARFPLIMRSDDGGEHWRLIDGPDEAGALVAAAWSSDGPALLGANGQVWREARAGWTATDLGAEGRKLVAFSGGLVAATATGLWVLEADDDDWFAVLSGGVLDLAADTDGSRVVALLESGEILVSFDAHAWISKGVVEGAGAVTAARGSLFVGVGMEVEQIVPELRPCGSLGAREESVFHLFATHDNRLWAAGALGIYASDLDCSGFELVAEGDGIDANNGEHTAIASTRAWSGAFAQGTRQVVSGYQGILVSEGGGPLSQPRLLSPLLSRAVGVGDGPDGGTRIWAASYGAGAIWSDDGGATWSGSGVGMSAPQVFGRDLLVWGDTTLYSGDDASLVSADAGAHWDPVFVVGGEGPMIDMAVGSSVAWATVGSAEGMLARSSDGARWQEQEVPPEVADFRLGKLAVLPVQGKEAVILSGELVPGVAWSLDGGENWAVVGQESLRDFLAWPEGVGDRMLARAYDGSVRILEVATGEWSSPEVEPAPLVAWAVTGSGAVLGLDGNGRAWASDDGGDRWVARGGVIEDVAESMVRTGAEAPVDAVVVAGRTGLFASVDEGASFVRLPRLERYDTFYGWSSCTAADGGECTTLEGDSLGGGLAQVLAPGDRLRLAGTLPRLRFWGDGPLLVGPEGGDAVMARPGAWIEIGGGDQVAELTGVEGSVLVDVVEFGEGGEGIPGWPAGGDTGEGPGDHGPGGVRPGAEDDAFGRRCACGGGGEFSSWTVVLALAATARLRMPASASARRRKPRVGAQPAPGGV
jgi:hypothetical protein